MKTPSLPRRDLQLEPLVEILEGKRLVHSHTYRADETLMLIRLAEEMGFKIATFQHILEGYKVADEMAKHGVGGSTFSDWWAYKVEAEDAIPYNAAIMHKRGVLVSINSDSAEHARRLNTEAAKSMHWGGLTEDEVFAFVTINPAKQLKIDNRVGSLEVGKDADVVIWNKHPLSTYAIVDRVYIDGQQVPRPPRGRTPAHGCGQGKEHAHVRRRTNGAEHRAADPAAAHRQRTEGRRAAADRAGPWRRAAGAGDWPGHGDHQRAHLSDQQRANRARHDRHSRQSHRGGRREPRGAGGRASHRREGRRGVSRLHRRADDDRPERTGPARV